MRCKHCRKKFLEDTKKVSLRLYSVHEECFQPHIDALLVKNALRRKRAKEEASFGAVKESMNKSKYKIYAWKMFARFIYARDTDKHGQIRCISCSRKVQWNSRNLHAGHFIPKSKGEFFYFNEDNVHGQCMHCNNYGSQHTGKAFDLNLRKKIGIKKVDKLLEISKKGKIIKHSLIQYKALAKKYRAKSTKILKEKNLC